MNIYDLEQKRINLIDNMKDQKMYEGFKDTLTKLYTQSGHFIYELIQNAEDCEATEIVFELSTDKLIFKHNGTKLFKLEDVDAITNIGNSTKTDDGNSIGKFGVGFKSVFEYTKTPTVHSGDFHFVIKDLFIPHPISCSDFNKQTIFELPFDNEEKSKENCFKEVKETLDSLPRETLLFLRHINKIIYKFKPNLYNFDSEVVLERKENDFPNAPKGLCTLSKTNGSPDYYVRFFDKVTVIEKNNKNIEENKEKEIEIALAFKAEANAEHDEKIEWNMKPILDIEGNPDGKVFTFFPCESEHSGLCFHIHAPFALTVSRQELRDEPANKEIKEKLAKLLAKSLDPIKDGNLLNMDFLKVLPNNDDNLKKNEYEMFKDIIVEKFNTEPFTPMQNGTYGAARGKLRSRYSIGDLFYDSDMNKILGTTDVIYWIKNPRQQNQRDDKFIQGLDCKDFNIADVLNEYLNECYKQKNEYDKISEKLKNPNFVLLPAQKEILKRNEEIQSIFSTKDAKWFIKFYDQLAHISVQSNGRIDYSSHNEKLSIYTKDKIRQLELCFCDDGNLRKFSDCFLPPKDNKKPDGFYFIHKDIVKSFDNNSLKEFFFKLGIEVFSEKSRLKQKIDTFLENLNDWYILIDIFRDYQKIAEKDSDLLNPLKENSCLLTNKGKKRPSIVYVPSCYNQDESYRCIPEYFKCFNEHAYNEGDWYKKNELKKKLFFYTDDRYYEFFELSDKYLEFLENDEIKPFFEFVKTIGCKTAVDISECSCRWNSIWYAIYRKARSEGPDGRITDKDCTVFYLEEFLKESSIEKFKFIWKLLKEQSYRDDYAHCYYRNAVCHLPIRDTSQFVNILKSTNWVAQDENGTMIFVRPDKAVSANLPITYQDELNNNFINNNLKKWLEIIDFFKDQKENSIEYKKKQEEQRHRENVEKFSQDLGFSSNVLLAQEQAIKENLITENDILAFIDSKRKEKQEQEERIAFRERNMQLPRDMNRFQRKTAENVENAEDVEYEKRERSVRSSNNSVIKEQARVKLRNYYTNDLSGTMCCQLCGNPMPFKDKQNFDYFFARQLFSSELIEKESDANYIALCPVCDAKVVVYLDDKKQEELSNFIIDNPEKNEFDIILDNPYKLYFAKRHILELLSFLGVEYSKEEVIKDEEAPLAVKTEKNTNTPTARGNEIQKELAELREKIKRNYLNPIEKENLQNVLLKLRRELLYEKDNFSKADAIPIRLDQIENYLSKLKENEIPEQVEQSEDMEPSEKDNINTVKDDSKKKRMKTIYRYGLHKT